MSLCCSQEIVHILFFSDFSFHDHAVLLKFIFLFHIIKVRDANILSFASPNVWGRLFFVVGGLLLYVQDQYINHIMAETGVTVSLRGLGTGSTEGACEGIFHQR